MTDQCIFSCFVDPETVDSVVDCLLCQSFVSGFSMHRIEGYSKEHANYTVGEQVAGHRSVCRLDIRLQCIELDNLTAALAGLSLQHRIRYWVTPVIDTGII
ncbi:DUF3240 family protein [uncultured Alteromonas sp.]|jgi:hypothetical protein|uniref:DUF3240 family protein n=1 Tax=uncultured Alteromonas sp. TaxID=179113 RepID=UPI0025CE457E|nr:DUF3240 family protein [uncultured Alteromonas sp.]